MGADLQTLAYFSRNVSGQTGEMPVALDHILEASRRNNAEQGITGALLYTDGWFAQVIEGPGSAVETVFEWIVLDDRHTDIRVLYLKAIEERSFASWSMAFAGSVDAAALAGPGDEAQGGSTASAQPAIAHHLVATLQKLVLNAAPSTSSAGL